MSILRKLITKEWFRFFLIGVFTLYLMLTIANLISGFLRSGYAPLDIIKKHFLESPDFLSKIFPVSCMVASLFSINKLKNRNELAAIFAAGFSRRDYIITLIMASSFAASIQFISTSYIQPLAKKYRGVIIEDSDKKFRSLRGKGLMSSTIKSGKIWYKSKKYYISFSNFDKHSNTLHNVDLYEYDSSYKFEYKLTAAKAIHKHDNVWEYIDGKMITNLNNDKFPKYDSFDSRLIAMHEKLTDFKKVEADITTLYIQQLADYIDKLDNSGINTDEYKVLLWDKYASSLICIIFALVASVGIFTPNRRNSSFGKNAVFVFLFTLIYWFVYSYSSELGRSSELPPIIACFSVPMGFVVYLSYLFYKNRKLS